MPETSGAHIGPQCVLPVELVVPPVEEGLPEPLGAPVELCEPPVDEGLPEPLGVPFEFGGAPVEELGAPVEEFGAPPVEVELSVDEADGSDDSGSVLSSVCVLSSVSDVSETTELLEFDGKLSPPLPLLRIFIAKYPPAARTITAAAMPINNGAFDFLLGDEEPFL